MSGTWETKKRILKILEGEKRTPSEISAMLELSPSTVTQHLKELKRMGAVREVDNPFVKKWKHFELNPESDAKILESVNMNVGKNGVPYVAALVVALLVIGSVVFLSMQSSRAPTLSGVVSAAVPIRLTDPPTVPSGTQALFLGYSSLQVHVRGQSNTTGWISSPESGIINLMSLVNESQVIGDVNLSQNASVDMIRFNVTSAKIVINGTAYNVTVPSSRITARIAGQGLVNDSASLLLDLSPVVATIYTNTSTVFVLVPSVRAVVVGGANAGTTIGSRAALSVKDRAELESAGANVTISAVSMSESGNMTQLSVTVKNNGNRSVQLSHILIYGNETITVHPVLLPTAPETNATERANQAGNESENGTIRTAENASISVNASAKTDITVRDRPGYANAGSNLSVSSGGENMDSGASNQIACICDEANGSTNATGAANVRGSEHESEAIGIEVNGTRFDTNSSTGIALLKRNNVKDLVSVGEVIGSLRVINLQIAQNGELTLPYSAQCTGDGAEAQCVEPGSGIPEAVDTGYNLTAGATVTFTFNGTVSVGFGRITVSPVPGDVYNIIVRGDEGAAAAANATAT